MDAMVSARVPVETRNQVNTILGRMGTTPTQLINAAYEYVLSTGHLPAAEPAPAAGKRTLSTEQIADLRESFRQTTCKVPASYFASQTDDELLEEALRDRHGFSGESA